MSLWARRSALALLGALALASRAEFPERPIKIVVPFQAGGAGDAAARILAEGMSKKLGQPVIVENKPGATGAIGTKAVALAAPDGHTLLLGHSDTLVLAPLTRKSLPYDPVRDFEPVAFVSTVPGVLIASRASGIASGAALIAAARARPGQVSLASWGLGSSPHLGLELMEQVAGIDLLHVPFQGTGPAVAAALAGQVDLVWVTPEFALGAAREGKAWIVGASSVSRIARAPDIPTLSEQGFPGAAIETWYALMLPAGTPKAIQQRLHDLVNALLADPDIARRLADGGHETRAMSIAEFSDFMSRERRRWSELIRSRHLPLPLD